MMYGSLVSICDRDVEFVHIFRSEYNSQVYVNCSSGLCQHSFGKKKKLQALRDSPNICRHLVTFRENSDEIGAFEGTATILTCSSWISNNIFLDARLHSIPQFI